MQSAATFHTLDAPRRARARRAQVAELGASEPKLLLVVGIDELIRAQAASAMALLPTVGMMPFHPMVDGEVLPERRLRARTGAAARHPMLIGRRPTMRLFLDLSGAPSPRDAVLARGPDRRGRRRSAPRS